MVMCDFRPYRTAQRGLDRIDRCVCLDDEIATANKRSPSWMPAYLAGLPGKWVQDELVLGVSSETHANAAKTALQAVGFQLVLGWLNEDRVRVAICLEHATDHAVFQIRRSCRYGRQSLLAEDMYRLRVRSENLLLPITD